MDKIPWESPANLHVDPAAGVANVDGQDLHSAVVQWLNLPERAQITATISMGNSADISYIEWKGHGINWLADRLPR